MHTLISLKHKKLILDMLTVAQEKVKRRGKQLSDLRFAKRTTNGYAFFEVGHEVWDMLHEIVRDVLKKNPDYDLAFVSDLCSEVMNADKEDLTTLAL